MKDENNNFEIDIEAETKAVSPNLNEEEFVPSQLFHVMKDQPLPEMVFFSGSQSFQNNSVTPQISTQTLGVSVKAEPEDAIMKVEETEKKLGTIVQGLQELSEGIQSSWLENRNKDDFEERVVVDPQNLLFEARRERMSQYPRWA